MVPQERLLSLLLQDSTRLIGEATFCLKESREWLARRRPEALIAPDSPLLRFYRCIHAFKGMCGLMAPRLPLAAELVPAFHLMEGRLAIRDNWLKASVWLPELERGMQVIRDRIQQARQQASTERGTQSSAGMLPPSVKASSGGRDLVFPWDSVVQFIPGTAVEGRPFVPVGDRLVAVVPSSGKAHENVAFGIAVRTKSGQEIVVPVQSLEIQQVESLSSVVASAKAA